MTRINPALLALAKHQTWALIKSAAVPPGGAPMDPAAGGAPPMDPSMMGGAPPGGAPAGMPPGGAPPMDPAMMGGGGAPMAPPMDPSMMGGQPGMMPGAAPQKLKPEQMMQMLDFRLYNMQQQVTAIMNHLSITVPAGALVTPPGSPTPVAEAALPGGPQDPGPAQATGGGGDAGGGSSAISSIAPIQGASPETAKQASVSVGTPYRAGASDNFAATGTITDRIAAVRALLALQS